MSDDPPRRAFIAESSIETDASVEDVLGILRNPSTWPGWQYEIVATQGPGRLEEGDEVVGTAKLLGFLVDGKSVMGSVTEGSLEQDVIVGVRMRVRFDLQPTSDGCIITHHLIADMPAGGMGRLLAWFLRRRFRKMGPRLLNELAAQSEASSVV